MLAQQARPLRLATLVLTSALFFVLIGPAVGAIVFFPDFGPLGALMVAHSAGFLPALLTGVLNAFAIMAGFIRSRSLRDRLLHAFVGGLCGFLITVLVFDYPDWVLLQRTSGWYDFWYTFRRSYAQFGMAGLLAGAVCSFIFNPWAQRHNAT